MSAPRPHASSTPGTAPAPRGATPPVARGELGDTGRAVATACLLAVLSGLALTIVTGSSSGASALLRVLHDRTVSPWMTPLWLDVGHDIRLTYGLPEDSDHFLEVVPASARGVGGVLRIPAAGDRSGAAARWRRLVRAAALSEESGDENAGVLSTAIGVGLLDSGDDDDVIVRFRRSITLGAGRRGREETVHEGRVRRVDGEIQWIPLPPAEEVAPLVDRGGGGSR